MTLRDARMAAGLTQTEMAQRWGRTQPQVVRIEKADPEVAKLATLRSFVEALGGTCRVVIEVDGRVFDL